MTRVDGGPPPVRVVDLAVRGGRRLAAGPDAAVRRRRGGASLAPRRAAAALRTAAEPILARVEDDELRFDLRTVNRFDDEAIARAIRGLLSAPA